MVHIVMAYIVMPQRRLCMLGGYSYGLYRCGLYAAAAIVPARSSEIVMAYIALACIFMAYLPQPRSCLLGGYSYGLYR